MNLSKRLLSLVKYIEHGDIPADIGCDHAYLSIYLVLNKIVDKAFISDINEGALNNGIKNIKKYALEANIKAKLSDGINDIDECVNTLIISGMGANTIINILSNKKISQIDKIITQSNNDHDVLRKYLCNNGYYIYDEEVIKDNNKTYINIVFKRGIKKYRRLELIYGPLLIKYNKDYFNDLYLKEKNILYLVKKKNGVTYFLQLLEGY